MTVFVGEDEISLFPVIDVEFFNALNFVINVLYDELEVLEK